MASLSEIILRGGARQADALREQADIEAERGRRTADTWGRSIATLGDVFSQIPQKMRQQKVEAQEDEQRGLNLRASRLEVGGMENAAAQQAKAQAIAQQLAQANGGKLDPDDYAAALESAGLPSVAEGVRAKALDAKKKGAELIGSNLKNQHDAIGLSMGLFSGVTDQQTFDVARKALPGLLQSPELASYVQQQLGDTYDPKKIEAVRDMGRSESERLQVQRDAIAAASAALTQAKTQAELDADLTKSAASLLSTARTPQEYTQLRELVAQGSKAVAAKFSPQFDAKNPRGVLSVGLTPDQIIDNAQVEKRDATAEAMARGNLAVAQGNLQVRQQEAAAATTPLGSVSPQAQAVVARLITGRPGTQIGPIKQEVARLSAAGDEEGLKSYLRFAATRTVGEARQEVMRGRVETLTALKDAETLLKEVPTGYLKGSWEDVMRKLGTTSDPRLVELGTRMGSTLANYVRSISGAAVNENEASRLKALLPNYSNSLPVNIGTMKGMAESIKSFDKGFYQSTFGDNYDWVMSPAGSGGAVTVQGVDGQSYTFPSQQAADAFKKAGG